VVGPECPHGLENIIERLIFVIGSKETMFELRIWQNHD
jgi:hypothetical protein